MMPETSEMQSNQLDRSSRLPPGKSRYHQSCLPPSPTPHKLLRPVLRRAFPSPHLDREREIPNSSSESSSSPNTAATTLLTNKEKKSPHVRNGGHRLRNFFRRMEKDRKSHEPAPTQPGYSRLQSTVTPIQATRTQAPDQLPGGFSLVDYNESMINHASTNDSEDEELVVLGHYDPDGEPISLYAPHDNIIKCYGYFHDEKTIYIIMELAPDGELYHRLTQRGKFPEDEAANYLVQIAHALQYLHEKHIIHRDLKPENILLGREGKLKLSDFGCSALTPQGTRKTFCGTTEYIPPEMFQYKEYSFSADIWSFGILVYELVCGRTPFFHEEAKQIQAAVIQGRITFPRDVSHEFQDLVKMVFPFFVQTF
ncbi:putative Aurora kinase [Blattamonas nauphoetae]|uniref:Aurora kinase n=1 Tax=Blattamonas nauphoetae TaxID=2049346 RepID=A0ABQ9XAW9_9EUKA|nr:putative Aurora kinase [Blattamonas nauphoetae]